MASFAERSFGPPRARISEGRGEALLMQKMPFNGPFRDEIDSLSNQRRHKIMFQ